MAEQERSVEQLGTTELVEAVASVASPEKGPPLQELSRAQLIAAMAESRLELSEDLGDLRESLSVSRRVESSYQRHIAGWLGASVLIGFLISRPLLRPRKNKRGSKVEEIPVRGIVAGTVAFLGAQVSRMALPAIRMAVTSYIGRQLSFKMGDDTTATVEIEDPEN